MSCPVLVTARRIYVGFKPTRLVEAIVAVNGLVVYAGSRNDAERIARGLAVAVGCSRPRVLEFTDSYALPGFVDAHLHLRGVGAKLYGIDLSDVRSIEEFKAVVAREVARFESWIIGRGWDQERMGAWPTRYDLDEVVPDKPVVLMRICGHAAVLNTVALKELGFLGRRSPDIDVGCDGEPTGLVFEKAAEEAYREAVRKLDQVKLILEAARHVLSYGVTLVGDMGVDSEEIYGLVRARFMGLLPLRVRIYLSQSLFEQLERAGVIPIFGDTFLAVKGVKMFMDGSLGARTAWLREPYSDASETRGRSLAGWRDVARLAEAAKRWGADVAVHAIGDAALAEALHGMEAARCRCRIEHASLAPPDLLSVAARLGVRIAVQPRFLVSDTWAADRLGVERVRWLYPFKTMISMGIQVGFSSDAPVEPVNPFEGIYAAATRGAVAGYTRDEALDVETGLHLYTAGSAAILGDRRAGCLEPGCYADIAVVDHDPLEVSVEELPGIRFEASIVGGELVWSR
ncbi:amidohydrolase [Hyperthermus butylicus]|uniref:Metal-dependent hydrolase n=1 Tax=Hyperthermus butylicus (strain DSM 5456 / JCM 9403 / PLM1-5) TaxID=415426 RepID=A2BLP7_HYPBU|nr:amidohydrolase [Hyperthermus butylicus]ABM80908.1 putative metal-dependent hydrolase [Hyperthermus butylicus DSM 5456]